MTVWNAAPATAPRGLRIGDLVAAPGGLLVFAFSFAPFITYTEVARSLFTRQEVSLSFNAWATEMFVVPLTTFVIFAALGVLAGSSVRLGLRRDPRLVGFQLTQLEVGLALFATVVLLGMVASSKHAIVGADRLAADGLVDPGGPAVKTGWGAIVMLIGALLLLTGTLLNHFGVGPLIPLGGGRPQPVPGWPAGQPPAGWQQPGPGGPGWTGPQPPAAPAWHQAPGNPAWQQSGQPPTAPAGQAPAPPPPGQPFDQPPGQTAQPPAQPGQPPGTPAG